ncbi:MAG: methyl-accepting chemotaxis protein [Pseudomonadota bacterium]
MFRPTLRRTVVVMIAAVSLFSVLAGTLTLSLLHEDALAERSERQLTSLGTALIEALAAQELAALSLATAIALDDDAMADWAAGDRDALQARIVPRLERFRADFGLANIVFHGPPATPFLRVHRPDRFGDDLSAGRPMLARAVATRTRVSGLEFGRLAGLSVRGIVPASHNGRALGVVDVGFSIKGRFGDAFIARKAEALNAGITFATMEDGALNIITSAGAPNPITGELVAEALTGKTLSREVMEDGIPHTLAALPLRNADGTPIAAMVIDLDRSADLAEATEARIVTAIIAAVLLLLSIALGMIVMSRPLRALKRTIAATVTLASGTTELTLADGHRRDEVGDLARSLNVFREATIKQRNEEAARLREHEVTAEQTEAALNTLSDEMEAQGGDLVRAICEQINAIIGAKDGLIASIGALQSGTAMVADNASLSLTRANTIASAAKELASSSAEIAQEVDRTAKTARTAAGEAADTKAVVEKLTKAASNVNDVVSLIAEIAEKTNLLALNATIEAARAGEAGKGFAVVAGEVKALANQTAKATSDITAEIEQMRTVTNAAVASMTTIGTTIGAIDQTSANAAAVVEQQTSATQEIARSISDTATSVREVSEAASTMSNNATDAHNVATELGAELRAVDAAARNMSDQLARIVRHSLQVVTTS